MPCVLRLRPVSVALIVPTALALCAWTRPQLPSDAPKAQAQGGARLDYVIVTVNGERRLVHAGEELVVVRGDRVAVEEGALLGRGAQPRELNVVGFQASGKAPQDDRGRAFDTAKDLKAKWSEDGKGELFAVLATSKASLHGAVFLKVIDPVLRYAEVTVNGRALVLRAGEAFTVGAKDKFKVTRVVTNLQSDEGVVFQIAPLGEDGAGGQDFEIRFLRGERPFASIPLKVKG